MRSALITLILLGALIFFLPQIASTEWAKKQIAARLETQLGGEIAIDKIAIHWFDIQECHKVSWKNPHNGLIIEADKVLVKSNLIDCIRFKEKPLDVILEGVSLDIVAGLKLLKKTQKDVHIDFSPISARFENGQITYEKIEMLINEKMKAHSWGQIDIEKENLAITLGLPQEILAKIFKECRKLPEEFLLEIPVACDLNVGAIQKNLFWYLLKNYATVTSLHK